MQDRVLKNDEMDYELTVGPCSKYPGELLEVECLFAGEDVDHLLMDRETAKFLRDQITDWLEQ